MRRKTQATDDKAAARKAATEKRLGWWWTTLFGDDAEQAASDWLDLHAYREGLRLNRTLHPDWTGRPVVSVFEWPELVVAVEQLCTPGGRAAYLEDPERVMRDGQVRARLRANEPWEPIALRWAAALAELLIDGWGDRDPSVAPEAVWSARHDILGSAFKYLPEHFDPLLAAWADPVTLDERGPWMEAVATVRSLVEMAGGDLPELDECDGRRFRIVFRAMAAKSQGKTVFAQIRKVASKAKGLWSPTAAQRVAGLDKPPDYEIEIAADWWLSCRTHLDTLGREWGVRLLYHELLHVDSDDNNRPTLRGHTVETFGAEVARHGARTVTEALLVTQAAAHPQTQALAALAGDSHSFFTGGEVVHARPFYAEDPEPAGPVLPPDLAALLELCRETLDRPDLPDAGADYVDDVQVKALGLREWCLDGRALTEAQAEAIKGWRGGINKWLKGA